MNQVISPFKNRVRRLKNYWYPYVLRRVYGLFATYKHPDFLIIGAQRGGTTSLFRYLMQVPMFKEPLLKEIHYFDLNWHKSVDWYFSHFPLDFGTSNYLTGEASPYYLFHPNVPARVAEVLPEIKLIVLLRDPVSRAISHYSHAVQLGFENRTFTDAVKTEMEQIESQTNSPEPNTLVHREQSYLARGIYVSQLNRWTDYFPKEQLLILNSERFFDTPHTSILKVLDFLGIRHVNIDDIAFIPHNRSDLSMCVSEEMCKQLSTFFTPYNIQLADKYNLDLEYWR